MMPTSVVVLMSPGGLLGTETIQGQEKNMLNYNTLRIEISGFYCRIQFFFSFFFLFFRRKEERKEGMKEKGRKESREKKFFQGYYKLVSLNGLTKINI